MKLYRSSHGPVVENDDLFYDIAMDWDELINSDDVRVTAENEIKKNRLNLSDLDMWGTNIGEGTRPPFQWLAPIGSQEVWAAGVTYFRSRTARMEESKSAGGGDFYDRVYAAPRPELFFKGMGHRAIGPGGFVRIRRDSKWNVPEPELTLVVNSRGKIVGYTIGNDMSSRDIEGENPLYLPQAKVYDGSLALGPAVLVAENPLAKTTEIAIAISRSGAVVFQGKTTLAQLKREPVELVEYLYRETTFANGCYLLTGTGVVPPDAFTLAAADEVRITIEGIGTLSNAVA